MIVRRATAKDADALTSCLVAAYAPFQHLGLPPVTSGVRDDIENHDVWVADVGGVVRGGVVVTLGGTAHIANLAVHPDAGGQGIGKALLDAAGQAAKRAGFPDIRLTTHAKMTATQAFYAKCGWVETGRAGDKVYLEKKLE